MRNKTYIKSQPSRLSRKGDLAALGEIKHIPLLGVHCLPALIGDNNLAFQDDLHLIKGVFVVQRGAFVQAEEAGGNGFLGVIGLASYCQY